MELKNVNVQVSFLVLLVTCIVVMVLQMNGAEAASCPGTGQLASACRAYVLGSNPPPPPPTGSCCRLLKASSPSCLCNAIPPNVASAISKKGLANVKSSCNLGGFSCPGIGK